jgi:hypothetical protein
MPVAATHLARSLVRASLRVAATTAIVVAGIMVATSWPSFANQRKLAALGMEKAPEISQVFATPMWIAAGGIWLLILDRSLLWWLVPTAGSKCPQCQYELKGIKGDKCPECGLTIR